MVVCRELKWKKDTTSQDQSQFWSIDLDFFVEFVSILIVLIINSISQALSHHDTNVKSRRPTPFLLAPEVIFHVSQNIREYTPFVHVSLSSGLMRRQITYHRACPDLSLRLATD